MQMAATEAEQDLESTRAALAKGEALTGDVYPSKLNRQEISDLSLRWSEAELARRTP